MQIRVEWTDSRFRTVVVPARMKSARLFSAQIGDSLPINSESSVWGESESSFSKRSVSFLERKNCCQEDN